MIIRVLYASRICERVPMLVLATVPLQGSVEDAAYLLSMHRRLLQNHDLDNTRVCAEYRFHSSSDARPRYLSTRNRT